MPRYLTLEEQYKFLKSLAKQYEHVQLKVVINENWENDDKNIARKVVITEIEKMMTKRLHLINFKVVGDTKIQGKNFSNEIYSVSIGDDKGLSMSEFFSIFRCF